MELDKSMSEVARALLVGAWDVHMHAGPDVVPRVQLAHEVLADARAAGMAAIGLKDHCGSTAALAAVLTAQSGAGGTRVLGSITLNPPAGVFNPAAVETALKQGARTVWFPTYSAKRHAEVLGKAHFPMGLVTEPVTLHDAAGRLRAGVAEILELIANYDAVVATGHLAPEESLALFHAAKATGVKRMALTHATLNVTAATVALQREAVALGAKVEHCMLALTPSCRSCSEEEMVAQILALGPENVFLTSDLGQVANGPVVASFGRWVEKLVQAGLPFEVARRVIAETPARLVG